MPPCHTGPSDILGRRLSVGDKVRVVGPPPVWGMTDAARVSFLAAFKALGRRSRKILGFDERGNAELTVRIAGELHILALEPDLLEWVA